MIRGLEKFYRIIPKKTKVDDKDSGFQKKWKRKIVIITNRTEKNRKNYSNFTKKQFFDTLWQFPVMKRERENAIMMSDQIRRRRV